MKPRNSFAAFRRGGSHSLKHGFTLPEILVTMTIFLFVLIGVTFTNLFGLRLFQMHSTKLKVSQWSRLTIENVADQIHSCYSVQVGNKTAGGFSGFLPGETNQGNGLLIQPTTNAANFIVYFCESGGSNIPKNGPVRQRLHPRQLSHQCCAVLRARLRRQCAHQ